VLEKFTRPVPVSGPWPQSRPLAALSALAAVLLALAAAILIGYFVIYLVYARSLLAFPFDYDQGEGFELYDAIRLARGENIYLDLSLIHISAPTRP